MQNGLDISLHALTLGSTIFPAVGDDNYAINFFPFNGSKSGRLKAIFRMRNDLACKVREHAGSSVIHDQGLWLLNNHAAVEVARKSGTPVVVSPRGTLEPWAMNHKAFKKKIAWSLYQKKDLDSVDLLHATSQQEAANFRELGLRKPIAILPNGVDLPQWQERTVPIDGKKTILFLSRVHPKKGLLNLVTAWQQVKAPGWRIVIAGPDEAGHKQEVMAAINTAGLQDSFEFIGPVDDVAKWDRYFEADLFVLPTYSENFGIVIAEALACGVPVITTTGTPWRELQTHNCGWWVETGAEPLAEALRSAVALTDSERGEMGQRGRTLVADYYSWAKIAKDMARAYAWVLGAGITPEFILQT
jgi:glycosyltransferase involved in cell wall biosynthesis